MRESLKQTDAPHMETIDNNDNEKNLQYANQHEVGKYFN